MLSVLAGCALSTATASGTAEDARARAEAWVFEAAPDPGLQIVTPLIEVPPYSNVMMCFFGTYADEDIGVNWMQPMSTDEATNHHNQIKAVLEDPYPDGSFVACPEGEGGMLSDYTPLFESVGVTPDTVDDNWLMMPEGIAMRLRSGQHWVIDTHYVNPTEETLWVRSAMNLGFVPADDVNQWASAFQFDSGALDIPPGGVSEVVFDCPFGTDVNLLSLTGHMHAHGEHYSIDHVRDGVATNVYSTEWETSMRDYPLISNYDAGAFPIAAADTLRTTCRWNNDTDESLVFPGEMCTTVGVAYPLTEPVVCFGDDHDR